MVRKTDQEKLNDIKQKREALLAQERKIKIRISKQERNARTKRLIEIGATIEAALEQEITADKLPALSAIIKQDHHKYDIINAINTQENWQ